MSKTLLSRCARAAVTLALLLSAAPLPAQLPPLISRDILFGNPERASPKLSPDGQRLAWVAPDKQNVLQVWVKTVGKADDKMVTADKKRGIRQYFWAEDNKTLLYQQDNDGDENFHVYGVDLASGNVRDYTPFQGVRAGVADVNPDFPDEILIEANIRNRQLMDVHRLNLKTGALTLDTENPGDVAGWGTDAKFQVRAAQAQTPDGGTEIRVREDVKAPWKTLLKVGPDEILEFEDFSLDGKSAFLMSSIGNDTARLFERNRAMGTEKVLAVSPDVDAGTVVIHPKSHVVQAVSFAPGRASWKVLDPSVQADFDAIPKLHAGDFAIVNRTSADDAWLIGFTSDRAPVTWYKWDRAAKQGTVLFSAQPKLEGEALELGLRGEENGPLLGRAVPLVPGHRGAVRREADEPRVVGRCAVHDREIACVELRDGVEVRLNGRIEHFPRGPPRSEGHRLHDVRLRMDHDGARIHVGRDGEHLLGARREIAFDEARRVVADGAPEECGLAVERKVLEFEDLVRSDLEKRLPRCLDVVAHADLGAAVRCLRLRGADPELRVRAPAPDVARVLGVQRQGAGLQAQAMHVHELAVADVRLDQDFVGEVRVQVGDAGAHALVGRVVADVARGEVHAVDVEVLVPVVVLLVEQRVVVLGPEVLADAALLVGRDHLVVVLARGLHPDLEDVLLVGRDPGEALAVRRQLRARPFGVSEQDVAGDERGHLGRQGSGRDEEGEGGRGQGDAREQQFRHERRISFPSIRGFAAPGSRLRPGAEEPCDPRRNLEVQEVLRGRALRIRLL